MWYYQIIVFNANVKNQHNCFKCKCKKINIKSPSWLMLCSPPPSCWPYINPCEIGVQVQCVHAINFKRTFVEWCSSIWTKEENIFRFLICGDINDIEVATNHLCWMVFQYLKTRGKSLFTESVHQQATSILSNIGTFRKVWNFSIWSHCWERLKSMINTIVCTILMSAKVYCSPHR